MLYEFLLAEIAGQRGNIGLAAQAYADPQAVEEELTQAKRLFTRHGWPVIDVTRRSIEETAAAIMQLRTQRLGVDV